MFGKRLAQERRRLGLSQESFAPYLGITRSALAMIETDRAPLQVDRLVSLAGHPGVDAIFVLTGEKSALAAASLLDWRAVEAILNGIHDWCARHEISLPPEKLALVLKILYEQAMKTEGFSTALLDDAMRLAA